MVGPDLGLLEIEWGGVRLRLRYPLGALKILSELLDTKVEIYELPQLLGKLNLSTIGVWVYCGLLHEEHSSLHPSKPMSLDDVTKFVEWNRSPLLPLIQAVHKAFALGVYGSVPSDSTEDESPDPKARRKDGLGRRLVDLLSSIFKSRPVTSGGGGISQPSEITSTPLRVVK